MGAEGLPAFTYATVGATQDPAIVANPPDGYRAFERVVRLGEGSELWARAARATLRFGIQRDAGVRLTRAGIADAQAPVIAGESFLLRIPSWPRWFPARVVWVVDTTSLVGFGYGTLPGHAESGEEAFIVERRADDSVWFTIRAFSRPPMLWWRAVDPVLRRVQAAMTRRYERAAAGWNHDSS